MKTCMVPKLISEQLSWLKSFSFILKNPETVNTFNRKFHCFERMFAKGTREEDYETEALTETLQNHYETCMPRLV